MPQPSQEDRRQLVQFVEQVLDLLNRLIREGHDPQGNRVLPEELLPDLRRAWDEFLEQFDLRRFQLLVAEAPAERLVWGGLYGAQLALKLKVIDRLRQKFMSIGGGKILKKLLDAIDRLLDSIISALGLDEALKEIKDIVSDNVEEEEA